MKTTYILDVYDPGSGKWVDILGDGSRRYVEGYAECYRSRGPCLRSRLRRTAEGKEDALLGEWMGLDHATAGAVPSACGYAWAAWARGAAKTLEHVVADTRVADRHCDNDPARRAGEAAAAALRILVDAGFGSPRST